MRIIGLTGGIACGKSAVSAMLKARGAVIVDGDRISHSLTAPGGPALAPLREAFGDGVFHPDGSLNRRLLGQLVFSDGAALQRLNSVMRPLLRREIRREIAEATAAQAPVCVLDMPLLFEERLDRLCRSVWCVFLPERIQLRRLMERDGLSEAEARSRIASQLPLSEKAARSTRILDNSGSLAELENLVEEAWQSELREEAEKHE